MGGSSGGGPARIGNVQKLIEQAKAELKGRRNVFISFAYEDVNDVNLLRGQAKNDNSPLEFNDWSVSEPYNSERAEYIRQRITERILQSSVTVVYVSNDSAKSEWCDWEVRQSIKLGKQVIGVFKGQEAPHVNFPALRDHGIRSVPWSELAKTIEELK